MSLNMKEMNTSIYRTLKENKDESLKSFTPNNASGQTCVACIFDKQGTAEHTFVWGNAYPGTFYICTDHAALLGWLKAKDTWYVEKLRPKDA